MQSTMPSSYEQFAPREVKDSSYFKDAENHVYPFTKPQAPLETTFLNTVPFPVAQAPQYYPYPYYPYAGYYPPMTPPPE